MTDNTLYAFGEEIDTQLVEPLRTVLVGRKLVNIPNTPKGLGVTSVKWNVLAEMSGGNVGYTFANTNEDTMNATPQTARTVIHWKDFSIDRGTYEAWKLNGEEFDAMVALSAAYVAAKVEDTTIIQGVKNDGSNYDINGLYNAAGNDYSTSKDFATFGNATIAVGGALDLLAADDIPTNIPFNLLLNPTQRGELRVVRSTSGIKEEPDVLAMLNGGDIIESTIVTAGTGLLLPTPAAQRPYFDYWLGCDWKTELGMSSEHPDTGPINGRVYSAGRLRMKESKALSKLSAI
jgi:uncharacterized linocin/CFP29 family protein